MKGQAELRRRVELLSDEDLDRALAAALARNHQAAESILAAVQLPPRVKLRCPWRDLVLLPKRRRAA